MKDGREGLRCNYNSINIFLWHAPTSKQVSLYPSSFLSSNKLLSVLILRPAHWGWGREREKAESQTEEDFLKQKTDAISTTAMSENRGVHRWQRVFPFSICCITEIHEAFVAPYSHSEKVTWHTPKGTKLILLQWHSQRIYHCQCPHQAVTDMKSPDTRIVSWSMLRATFPAGVMGQARFSRGTGWFRPAEIRSSTNLMRLLDKKKRGIWPAGFGPLAQEGCWKLEWVQPSRCSLLVLLSPPSSNTQIHTHKPCF